MRTWLKSFIRTLAPRSNKQRAALLFLLAALIVAAMLLSLCCGSRPLSPHDVLHALQTRREDSVAWRILAYVRIPRTFACLLAGGALALAGALLQSVLGNVMASPNVIGVNAGAGFFAMLAAVLLPASSAAVNAAAFLGALLTALAVYTLSSRAGLSRTTLILAGIAVSSMLTAGMNTITLLFPEVSIGASGFMLGGFSGVTLSLVGRALPYLLTGFALAFFLHTGLNMLRLGDESAASLGLHVARTRFLSILAAALLAGAAVSFAGLLNFVGLLFPNIARRLVGSDNRFALPASALCGGLFVLICDVFARTAFAPFELPVGVVMSLLGGPFFLYLLLKGKRSRML